MSLQENDIKEELSYAYVHAVASRCGFAVERPKRDNDSVDIQISGKGQLTPESKILSPSLHLQLKATSPPAKRKSKPANGNNTDGLYPFELSIKNYNDLRGNRQTPRLLVVLFLPSNVDRWLSHTEEGLVTRRCAYWCSLRDLPDVENENSKTVYVPKANILNCETLRSLMIRISKGTPP
jgi:hypothetical protein